MPSRRRSVGQSAPAPKLARQGPGGEPPGRGPGRHRPSHPTLRCPARPAHSILFPDVFSRFTGTSKPAGCRASGWPRGPSVRPSAAAPCRQEHPFPSGRRMHACRLPPAGKDLDLTVSPSWEGRPSLASRRHAACLPALPGRFALPGPVHCFLQAAALCWVGTVVRRTWAARGVDRGLFHPSHASHLPDIEGLFV